MSDEEREQRIALYNKYVGKEKTMQYTIAGCINRAKQEILADIQAGVVPSTVKDFSEIHEHVDGNCYGGLCDDDFPFSPAEQEGADFCNEVQDQLDRWLKAGRPAK
jgi:hypothetical protein